MATTPTPLTSNQRSDRTRARAVHAKNFALSLALASDLSASLRADVAHILLGVWTADAYSPAREILTGIAEGADPPTVEPGQAKIAVARRLARAVADAVVSDDRRSGMLQLEHLIRELRHAWLGRDADAAEMVILRAAARSITERRAANKAADIARTAEVAS